MSDFAAARIDMPRGATVAMATHGTDDGLYVEFSMAPSPNPDPELSEEAGYDVFTDIPWVHILVPGDRTKEWFRPAKLRMDDSSDTVPTDVQRFPRQWAAFQDQSKKSATGLPIEEWPAITKSEAQAFKRMDIYTVEQLAALPDTALNWLGARQRRDQAKVWLESAKGHAVEMKLTKENDQLRAQIEAMQRQIDEMAERFGEDQPRRRGRPPKHEE